MKNKIFNVFVSLLLIGAFFIIVTDILHAQSTDYTYDEYNGVARITEYTGNGGDITIPSTLGGLPTGYIGNNAFNNNKGHLITSVIIPNSVTIIEYKAFYGCNLIESITIGSSVTYIGDDVLQDCTSLISIKLLMNEPPQVGCECWVDNTSDALRGHAFKNSGFPSPGETWYEGNLTMGEYINLPPTADFTYSPSYPTDLDNIQFTDKSTDNIDGISHIISWNWNFGDGTTSNLKNPTHKYTYKDRYTITLTVTDNLSASNSKTKTIDMTNKKPHAYFTYSPTNPTDLDTIKFTDESADSDGSVTLWNWNFDDETTSNLKNPTHKYTDNGKYSVTLTVTDDDDTSDSVTIDILVSNIPPTANFSYNPINPTNIDNIQFTDTSNDPDGTITTWNWNLGDNTDNSGKTIKHIYTTTGTYQISLTVTDNDGATNTKKTTITIKGNKPPIQPTINGPKYGQKNKLYTFTINSSDPDKDNIRYILTWDDETSYENTSIYLPSNTPYNFSHRWTTPGAYKIKAYTSDNKTESPYTYHTILIDIKYIGNLGYLINQTGNNDYEKFYSNITMKETNVQKQINGIYLIDNNGDGNWDYTFDEKKGLTTYQQPKTQTPGYELILIINAIIIALYLWKKNKEI